MTEKRLDDLIHVLVDPDDEEAYDRAFDLAEAEPLDIDEDLLSPECDLPYMRQELCCNELAEIGPEAQEAIPALLRCAQEETDDFSVKCMKFAAVTAIWKVTSDPVISVETCERLLLDSECWFRRWVVELLEEIASPLALPALRRRLSDERPEVRERARKAIAIILDRS